MSNSIKILKTSNQSDKIQGKCTISEKHFLLMFPIVVKVTFVKRVKASLS